MTHEVDGVTISARSQEEMRARAIEQAAFEIWERHGNKGGLAAWKATSDRRYWFMLAGACSDHPEMRSARDESVSRYRIVGTRAGGSTFVYPSQEHGTDDCPTRADLAEWDEDTPALAPHRVERCEVHTTPWEPCSAAETP